MEAPEILGGFNRDAIWGLFNCDSVRIIRGTSRWDKQINFRLDSENGLAYMFFFRFRFGIFLIVLPAQIYIQTDTHTHTRRRTHTHRFADHNLGGF